MPHQALHTISTNQRTTCALVKHAELHRVSLKEHSLHG